MINIRKALDKDSIQLTDIFISARENMTYLPTLYSREETLWWISNIVLKETDVHIAEINNESVGFLAKNGDIIEHLYIHPKYQNRKIGQFLLNICMDLESKLELWVFQKNTGAIRFYEKNGFKLIEQTNGSRNEEKVPDARYGWLRPS